MSVKEKRFEELVLNVASKLRTKENFQLGAPLDIGVTIAQNRGKFKLNVNTYLIFKSICESFDIFEPYIIQDMWLEMLRYTNK